MSDQQAKRPGWALWLPLGIFLVLGALVAWGLANPGTTEVKSAMVGKPLPAIDLPPAFEGEPTVTLAGNADKGPRVVNIFASWCIPCIAEAPVLDQMKAQGVTIDGVAIRDKSEDIADFLQRNGNPYRHIARDDTSAVQFEIGSSGVPESFVIDADGIIRYQHIGPIMERDVPQIMAQLERAEQPL